MIDMSTKNFLPARFPLMLLACVLASPAQFAGACLQDSNVLSEEAEELQLELREAQEFLEQIDQERDRVREEVQVLSKLLSLQNELDRIDRELDGAHDDDSRLAALEGQRESIEFRLDAYHSIRELRVLRFEMTELAAFLREERDESEIRPVIARLDHHRAEVTKLLDVKRKLVHAGVPLEEEWDDDELTEELEESVEGSGWWINSLHEFVELTEEGEADAAEDLWREIASPESLRPKTGSPGTPATLPSLLPIALPAEMPDPVSDEELQKQVMPILKRYCYDCHSNDGASGDLNLEQMLARRPFVRDRAKWINVIEQTRNRVMPPPEANALPDDLRIRLVTALYGGIEGFDYKSVRHPGFEETRRLTHVEYDNTVRDLFGVPVEIAGRFPDELAGRSGFDNSGNTLFLQPLLMERYLTAADEIVEELLPKVPTTDAQRVALARVFFRRPAEPAEEAAVATELLTTFARRAYRRPLRPAETALLQKNYSGMKAKGESHFDAVRNAIRRILISPNFLLKTEEAIDGDDAFRVSDGELANRLSYFLWASMPDETLMELADKRVLNRPDVLAAQVDRMLDDPRAKTLGSVFAAQWLGSRHLGTRVRLDPIDNPWCTDSLMEAMRQETALFVHSLIVGNQSASDLLTADYTFLNQELAELYGIQGVRGSEMRRVDLASSRERGGLLGHGSILAVTSFPYRTSPVVRGKWVLETLLGTPPPPPPPNVSELSEELQENDRLSVREKLERHRRLPQCSSCHSEMDPLGLSLEKYDWFGRYRERVHGRRIDDTGTLPDGAEFAGMGGLRQVLASDRAGDLVRQVASKMLSYALGRQLEYFDEHALRKIISETRSDQDRFRTLIHAVVRSYPFQFKQTVAERVINEGGIR